ncbi:hypothetical protein BHE74_00002607, partial [Ensete ventricosum]
METIVAVASSASPSGKLIASSSSLLPHGFLFPSLSPRRLAVAPARKQTRLPLRSAAALGRRQTLSEGWDISGSVRGAFRMPRFEEMDTTNTLLRQRIVFLGSQVLSLSLISLYSVTGTRIARYRVVPPKIDRRRLISIVDGRLKKKSTVGGQLREKSTVGGRLRKKKGRRRGKEEKKKRKIPRPQVARGRGRFFSCARRRSVSPRGEKDR